MVLSFCVDFARKRNVNTFSIIICLGLCDGVKPQARCLTWYVKPLRVETCANTTLLLLLSDYELNFFVCLNFCNGCAVVVCGVMSGIGTSCASDSRRSA